MRINTNVNSLSLYANTSSKPAASVERLSSGLRINASVDDAAAGLKIASALSDSPMRDRVTLSSGTPSSINQTYGPSGRLGPDQLMSSSENLGSPNVKAGAIVEADFPITSSSLPESVLLKAGQQMQAQAEAMVQQSGILQMLKG